MKRSLEEQKKKRQRDIDQCETCCHLQSNSSVRLPFVKRIKNLTMSAKLCDLKSSLKNRLDALEEIFGVVKD